jgi:hypothetical protein
MVMRSPCACDALDHPPLWNVRDKALSLSYTHTDDSLTVHELGHELEVTSPWGRVGIP